SGAIAEVRPEPGRVNCPRLRDITPWARESAVHGARLLPHTRAIRDNGHFSPITDLWSGGDHQDSMVLPSCDMAGLLWVSDLAAAAGGVIGLAGPAGWGGGGRGGG